VSRSREGGFTLVELMISLVLFSFAIAGVLAVAVSMSQGFREQRAAVQAEGAARLPLDFIADAIRQSSPGAPTNLIFDSNTCTNYGIQVYNNPGTPAGAVAGTDKLDVIFAAGAVVTSTRAVYTTTTTSLAVTDASQLAVGDTIVISDTAQGVLVKITSITGGNVLGLQAQGSCASTPSSAGPYPAGALVIRAQHASFWVGTVDGNPTLMMDPDGKDSTVDWEPMAEGVEDMQLVKGMDSSTDGIGAENSASANADEWIYNNASDSDQPSYTLRAVRVTLVARTLSGLIGNLKAFNRPAIEDHTGAAANTDNFRRRILKTTVEVRNMSVSP
jgi:type IV pilus assembly protein PilW